MNYNIKRTFKEGLKAAGADFTIWYRHAIANTVTGYDPYYKTITKYNYSTAKIPSGQEWVSTCYMAKGILNSFSKGLNYLDEGVYRSKVAPDGIARGTFWLDSVLINIHSVSGPTLFSNGSTVECNGGYYRAKNQIRVGIGDERVLVVVFDKI